MLGGEKNLGVTQVTTRRTEVAFLLIFLVSEAVRLGACLKNLGFVLKCKGMMFGAHLRALAHEAQRVMAALESLMSNVGGPSENQRHLFASVMHSVLI